MTRRPTTHTDTDTDPRWLVVCCPPEGARTAEHTAPVVVAAPTKEEAEDRAWALWFLGEYPQDEEGQDEVRTNRPAEEAWATRLGDVLTEGC